MKNILFLVCVFACTIITATAQTDTKAKAILDALSQKLDALETMKFEFSYSMLNTQENISESKTGSIYIKDDKYRLYIADQLIICDGTTIWTVLKEDNEVQINSIDPTNQNTPNKMLTSYSKNYKAKFIKEAPKAGFVIQTLDLTPVTTQSFYKVRLEINKNANMVYSSTIFDKNGTTYTYMITNFTENPKILESRFVFDQANYPGISVNDMR